MRLVGIWNALWTELVSIVRLSVADVFGINEVMPIFKRDILLEETGLCLSFEIAATAIAVDELSYHWRILGVFCEVVNSPSFKSLQFCIFREEFPRHESWKPASTEGKGEYEGEALHKHLRKEECMGKVPKIKG